MLGSIWEDPSDKASPGSQGPSYAPNMNPTAITIDASLGNRLRESAKAHGLTVSQEIKRLLETDEANKRRLEVAKWHAQVRANPPDAEYWQEFREWERITGQSS